MYDALKVENTELTLEVQQQLGDGIVRTIALGSSDGLKRGLIVTNTGGPISVPVGPGTLGPHHGRARHARSTKRGPVEAKEHMVDPPQGAGLSTSSRRATDLLETGIKVIDLLVPVRQGRQGRPVRRRRRRQDREHARADQQHRQSSTAGLSVFAGVGERTREGNDFYHEMAEAGVIELENSGEESKVAMVYGQMNEPPGNRLRVALTGLTMAEVLPRRSDARTA